MKMFWVPAVVIVRVHPDLSTSIISIKDYGECPIDYNEFEDLIEKIMPDLLIVAREIASYKQPSKKFFAPRGNLLSAELRSWIHWCDGTVDLILVIDTEI